MAALRTVREHDSFTLAATVGEGVISFRFFWLWGEGTVGRGAPWVQVRLANGQEWLELAPLALRTLDQAADLLPVGVLETIDAASKRLLGILNQLDRLRALAEPADCRFAFAAEWPVGELFWCRLATYPAPETREAELPALFPKERYPAPLPAETAIVPAPAGAWHCTLRPARRVVAASSEAAAANLLGIGLLTGLRRQAPAVNAYARRMREGEVE